MALAAPTFADEPTLDELLDLEPGETDTETAPESPTADDGEPGVDLDEDVREMLRGDAATDAFEQAVGQMDSVARRLGGDLDPGLVTQREQESILAKLEQVIEAAKQQQSSSQGGQGGEGQQQAREQDTGGQDLAQQGSQGQQGEGEGSQGSQSQGGGEHSGQASPGSVVDGEQHEGPLEELRREWGQLPPRLRDELSEGLQERFSPAYRSLTEAYYRRLAEEE
ncbi:MAG: hypothetical protein WDZ31_14205 [Phycisphaeraceae bacterium]